MAVVLDCTKTFDLAKFNILFERLLARGMPAVVVRVLAHSYMEQEAWARWGRTSCSSTFGIANGTSRQSCLLVCVPGPSIRRTQEGGDRMSLGWHLRWGLGLRRRPAAASPHQGRTSEDAEDLRGVHGCKQY